MKNLYIPKGKTVHYETLSCQNIVNDGILEVEGTVHARNITGKGVIHAGTISARSVAAMDVECAVLIGETLVCERVCAAEIKLSVSAVVSCYLDAEYVEVPKLTVAKHSVGTLKAKDVVALPEKKRGVIGTLLAGFFRRLWLSLTYRIPLDAPYVQTPGSEEKETKVQRPPASGAEVQAEAQAVDRNLEDDFEFKRLKAMYQLLKDSGYVLRITRCEEQPEKQQLSSEQEPFFKKAA